ncbi:deoxyhypusine synthase [Candidatus Thorarchaeota archaeon]|nr:MAG: deoxyhypusine synthase [Candidatus Thorarchaeota archaeon]
MRGSGFYPPGKRPGLASSLSPHRMTYHDIRWSSAVVTSLERVHHVDPLKAKELSSFLKAMNEVGVLGAGRLGRATDIVQRMFEDPDCFTYLSMSGPMVPGGLRAIICHLVKQKHIDTIVTSGANIVHDLVEAFGGAHYRVPQGKDDYDLRAAGMGRIADIFVKEEDFEKFEKGVYGFLDTLPQEKMTTLAPSEFLLELGLTVKDETSIVHQAALNNIPIFSPGLMDSMLGFHLYTYSTTKKLALDFVKDLRILGEIVTQTKKTGAIMLGGGLTKHFTMGSTILRGGLDMAVQITLDRPEGGSVGGAPLVEGVSWQKVQAEANFETVIGDATVIFPLMMLGVLP